MIFFDSYVILEIIKGNAGYEKYQEEILITNSLNLAEVFYSLLKETNEETTKKIISKLTLEMVDIDEEIAMDSAIFRYKNRKRNLS